MDAKAVIDGGIPLYELPEEPVGPTPDVRFRVGNPVGLAKMLLLDRRGNPVEAIVALMLLVLLEQVSLAISSALTARLSVTGCRLDGSVLKKQFGPIADGM